MNLTNCCTCCDHTLWLGCLSNCATLLTNIEASEDAVYQLKLGFLNSVVCAQTEALQGELLSFDISSLNESFSFKGKLVLNGKPLVIQGEDGTQYDCLSFTTQVGDCHASNLINQTFTILIE